MGAAIGRQVAHEVGHPPFAGAVLAGGQHQLARRQNLAGRERHQQARPAVVQPAGRDGGGGDVVAHRQAEDAAIPQQIFVPVDARDQVHVGEGLRAVLRLVPRLEGQARHAEVGSGLQLGAAQGRHAGEGDPGAFLALGRAIDDQDVAHALAHQAEGRDSPDWPAPTISTSSAGLPACSRGTIHSICGCAVSLEVARDLQPRARSGLGRHA